MTWIPESCKSGWMRRNNFSFNIAFDDREERNAILQREFNCENSFKEEMSLWEDEPFIVDSKDADSTVGNSSSVYHLEPQQ